MHPAGVTLLALGADTASCLARLAATRPSRFAKNAVASAISGNVEKGPASLNSGQLVRVVYQLLQPSEGISAKDELKIAAGFVFVLAVGDALVTGTRPNNF
jgi:hypothetical protein